MSQNNIQLPIISTNIPTATSEQSRELPTCLQQQFVINGQYEKEKIALPTSLPVC